MSSLITPATDWTVDPKTGRSNSSEFFLKLVEEVGRLIHEDIPPLQRIGLPQNHTRVTARLVLAQLAHTHGLAPVNLQLNEGDNWPTKIGKEEKSALIESMETTLDFLKSRLPGPLTPNDILARSLQNLSSRLKQIGF